MNYPLGHTTGRPNEPAEQLFIVRAALGRLTAAGEPGTIVRLSLEWPDDWKTGARRRGDTRTPRHDTPQWERPEDAVAAQTA